jgi:hypothetical protein
MAAAPPARTTIRVTATGGMPGWQITLIAAIAAILAAATAVLPAGPHRQPAHLSASPLTPQLTPNRAHPHSSTASPNHVRE